MAMATADANEVFLVVRELPSIGNSSSPERLSQTEKVTMMPRHRSPA